MQVPLELNERIVEYVAAWSWGTPGAATWIFTASGGRNGSGSGPFLGEQTWSTTALTPQNTGVNVHYKVPHGYGAWFVAAGGGSPPCPVKTGQATAWAWTASLCSTSANDAGAGTIASGSEPKHCTETIVTCPSTNTYVPSRCYIVVTDVTKRPVRPTGYVRLDIHYQGPDHHGVGTAADCPLNRTPGGSPKSTYCVADVWFGHAGLVDVSGQYIPDDGLHKSSFDETAYNIEQTVAPPITLAYRAHIAFKTLEGIAAVAGLGAISGPFAPAYGAVAGIAGAEAIFVDIVLTDPPDPRYRSVATPRAMPVPKLPPGNLALDRALRTWLSDAAKARALYAVLPTTLNRAVTAGRAGDITARTAQVHAASRYLKRAAGLFDAEVSVERTVAQLLVADHLDTLTLSAASARTIQQQLAKHLPSEMMAILRALGAKASQIASLRHSTATLPAPTEVNLAAELVSPSLVGAEQNLAAALRLLAKNPAPNAFRHAVVTIIRPPKG